MRRIGSMCSIIVLLFGMTSAICAQTDPPRAPDGTGRSFIPGITVLPYTNLPFSGADTIQWVRQGNDGGTVTTYLEARNARDSAGRIYRERHHFAPAGVDAGRTLYEFSISDPVAGTMTVCTVLTHSCVVTGYRPGRLPQLRPAGVYDNGRRSLERVSLGSQTIQGVPVEGTREITTIQPGTAGNDKPLVLKNEYWYAPDLKTNVLVIRDDPREGKVMVALKLDSRGEPDPSVFVVPGGYTVRDLRPHGAGTATPGPITDALACPAERVDCQFPGK